MATCLTAPILLKICTEKYLEHNCNGISLNARRRRPHLVQCSASTTNYGDEVGIFGESRGQNRYLVTRFGWGVRRMIEVGEEMRSVAYVQAEAFHEPVALFNDFFLDFFKAEVLAALIYKLRNSAPDRYACLVAESFKTAVEATSHSDHDNIVGVVDITVQRDEDVIRHINGAYEYVYVSGIAVLVNYRRKKVGTVLLEACDTMSRKWGHEYLALRAYEDDSAAQRLYTYAGYRIVSTDPFWVTLIGKRSGWVVPKIGIYRVLESSDICSL